MVHGPNVMVHLVPYKVDPPLPLGLMSGPLRPTGLWSLRRRAERAPIDPMS